MMRKGIGRGLLIQALTLKFFAKSVNICHSLEMLIYMYIHLLWSIYRKLRAHSHDAHSFPIYI